MQIAHRNMRIAIESILPLTYVPVKNYVCENKNVSYEAHLCPIIVKAQRAPNAQATLQIVHRHYEEFLSPATLTLKPLRRPSNRSWENRQNLHVFNLWPVKYHTEKNIIRFR